MNILVFALTVSLLINLAMFVVAYVKQTDTLTDISYAVTFAVVSIGSFAVSDKSWLQTLVVAMVLMWAFRIGSFLLNRIRRIKRDNRFDGMRENFWKFIRFWILQGLTVFVVLMATILLMQTNSPNVSVVSVLGLILALSGLTIETIADNQKSRFSSVKSNGGKWIDSGLWRISRHPNYFGEIAFWLGIYLACAPALVNTSRLVGALSPLYIACLIIFVSGIPLLEKSANKKWGSNESYKKYRKVVPVLIPSLSSLRRLFTQTD